MRKEHGWKILHEKIGLEHVAVRYNSANRAFIYLILIFWIAPDCFSIGRFSYFRLDWRDSWPKKVNGWLPEQRELRYAYIYEFVPENLWNQGMPKWELDEKMLAGRAGRG